MRAAQGLGGVVISAGTGEENRGKIKIKMGRGGSFTDPLWIAVPNSCCCMRVKERERKVGESGNR